MLNGKQKAYLRSLAHNIDPVFQIGKDGITDNMLRDIKNYLLKHEIMKVSVLNNCMEDKASLATIFELVFAFLEKEKEMTFLLIIWWRILSMKCMAKNTISYLIKFLL